MVHSARERTQAVTFANTTESHGSAGSRATAIAAHMTTLPSVDSGRLKRYSPRSHSPSECSGAWETESTDCIVTPCARFERGPVARWIPVHVSLSVLFEKLLML